MAIIRFVPTAPHPTLPDLPKTGPDNYKGIDNDNKYVETHKFTRFVEGFPMTVEYYGQILGFSNDIRDPDPAQAVAYQQYYKIKDLEIRVDKPLEQTYDNDTQFSEVTGSANIIPDVRVQPMDCFVCRITRGRPGLFRIVDPDRKTMNRDSVYNVTYTLVGYIDRPGEARTIWESMEAKIKDVYYFSGSRLMEGASPLLREKEHNNVISLAGEYDKIVTYYIDTFSNPSYQTLVVPGQPAAVYDRYLVDFFLGMISVQDHLDADQIKQLGMDKDRYAAQIQFWKALKERNEIYIRQANRFMGLVDRGRFNGNAYIAGAAYSSINSYIYPISPDLSVKLANDPNPYLPIPGLVDTISSQGLCCSNSEKNIWKDPTGNVPLYKSVLCDAYYVLSYDFYERDDNWSLLEKLTWDYLRGNAINTDQLLALTKQYYVLNRLEQFYYGPILLALIVDTQFKQYS